MDIFNFFESRDKDLEATILAEKEMEVASTINVKIYSCCRSRNQKTDMDEVMEDVATSLHEYTLLKAELSIWNAKSKIQKILE